MQRNFKIYLIFQRSLNSGLQDSYGNAVDATDRIHVLCTKSDCQWFYEQSDLRTVTDSTNSRNYQSGLG